MTAVVTPSFLNPQLHFWRCILCRLFIGAECQRRKRMGRVLEGFSSTCVNSYSPCAQRGAGILSQFSPGVSPTGNGQQQCSKGCAIQHLHGTFFHSFPQAEFIPPQQSAEGVMAEGLGSQAMAKSVALHLCVTSFIPHPPHFLLLRAPCPPTFISRTADEEHKQIGRAHV